MGRIATLWLVLTVTTGAIPANLGASPAQPPSDQDSLPISHDGDAALRSTRVQLARDSDNMGVFTDERPDAVQATVYKFTDPHDLAAGENGDDSEALRASVHRHAGFNDLNEGEVRDGDNMHHLDRDSLGAGNAGSGERNGEFSGQLEVVGEYQSKDHGILSELKSKTGFGIQNDVQTSLNEFPEANDVKDVETIQSHVPENFVTMPVDANQFSESNIFTRAPGQLNGTENAFKLRGTDHRSNLESMSIFESVITDHPFDNNDGKHAKMMDAAQGDNAVTSESEEKEKFLVELARRILDVRKQGFSKTSFIIHPNNSPLPTYHPLNENLKRHSSENKLRKVDVGDRKNVFGVLHDSVNNSTEPAPENVLSLDSDSEVTPDNSQSDDATQSTEVPSLDDFSSAAIGISPHTSLYEKLQPSPEDEPLVSSLVSQLKEILNSTEISTIGSTGTEPPLSTAYHSVFSETETTVNPDDSSIVVESTDLPNISKNDSENAGAMEGEVTDFLQSVASSSGFQGAFVGELIKSFSSLNHNAMSLLYNLLIGPLKLSPTIADFPANENEENSLIVSRNSSKGAFEPSEQVSNRVDMEELPSEDIWLPFKSRARTSRDGYAVEVITAPSREKFELVVGSSLSSEPRNGAMFQRRSGLPDVGNLQMGMSMPPPEALGALPPGAQIILPSQMRRKPVLPKITIGEDNIPVPVIETRPPRRREPQANPLDVFSSLPNFFSSLFSSPTEQPHKRPGPSRRRRLPGHPYRRIKNRPNSDRQLPSRTQLARDKFDGPLNLQPPGIPLVHKMVHPRPSLNNDPNIYHSINSQHQLDSPPLPPNNAFSEPHRPPGDAHQFGTPHDRSHLGPFIPSREYRPQDRGAPSEFRSPQLSAENAIGFFPKPRAEGGFVPLTKANEAAERRTQVDQFGVSSHFAVRHEMNDKQNDNNRRTFSLRDPYTDRAHVPDEDESYHYSSEKDFEPIYRVSHAPGRNPNRIIPQKVTFDPSQPSDSRVQSNNNDEEELGDNSNPSMYQHFSNPSLENHQRPDQQLTKLIDSGEDSKYSASGKKNPQNTDSYSYIDFPTDYSYDSGASDHRLDREHLLPSSHHPKLRLRPPTQGITRKPIEYYEEVLPPVINFSVAPLSNAENSQYGASVDLPREDFEASEKDNSNYNRPSSNTSTEDHVYHETKSKDDGHYSPPQSSSLDVDDFSNTNEDKRAEDSPTYGDSFYEYYENNPELLYPDFTSKRITSEPSEKEQKKPHEMYDVDPNGYEYDNVPQASFSHVDVVSTEPAIEEKIDDYPTEYYEYVYYDDANDPTQDDHRPEKEKITFGSFNSSFGDYETDGFVVKDVVPMVGTVRPINQSTMFNHNMAKSQEEDTAHDNPLLGTPIKPVNALNNIQLSQMFEDDVQSLQIPVSDIDLSRAPESKIQHHRPLEEDPDSSAAYLFNTIDLVPQSADLFNTRHTVDQNAKENPTLHNSTSKFNFTYSETTNIVEEVPAQEYMAYVLIGSCIGLSLLSISGVLLIVKFKKTCGSRQIRSRQRLKKSSLPDVSHVQETFLESDPGGHKLGSWFTGKGGTFGSSKLRSNMALPSVDDLRRDQPERSSSRRDLLSSASDTSEGSDRVRSQDEPVVNRSKNNSWSSKEKEASQHDANQTSPTLEVLSEPPKRQSFERDARDNQRNDHECKHQRPHSSQSSEFQKKRLPEPYTTDSEFYDPTSADEGRSSRFMETSHDFDTMRGRKSVTTSQELGEKLSRDIRNFHERASPVTSRDSTVDRGRRNPEGEGNLRRTTSEVSFTRDNVQNEVFLEFDNIFKQHGQYLTASDGHHSSLDRASEAEGAADKRSNSPDSIENPKTPSDRRSPGSGGVIPKHSRNSDGSKHHRNKSTSVSSGKLPRKSSPPTPPRFTPPPPPPRPPKPERLSKSFGQESADASHLPPPKSDRLV